MKTVTIATRASQLALWQAYYIKEQIEKFFPGTNVKLNEITSRGDKILDKPLALIGGKGHFTKELEDEMLAGNADLAVHSLKDVPTFIPEGLELAAVTKRQDQSDLFLSYRYKTLDDLPEGAVVGTTSLRRRMQILVRRPDLTVKDLRGNVNTRLRKLAEGQYDAIILAYIGLKRLNLIDGVPYTQKLDFMIPPMGQAALGIEIVKGKSEIAEIAAALNNPESYHCTKLERDFISLIGAGCSAPVAVNATYENEGRDVKIRAMLGYPDGSRILYEEIVASAEESDELGKEMAHIMLKQGAKELLEEAEKNAFKEERPQRL